MNVQKTLLCFFIFTIACKVNYAQQQPKGTGSKKDTVLSAGPEYNTSSIHRFFWGQNYRDDWAVPLRVPVVYLDQLYGGVKPIKAGGGNQTKSLQVETKSGQKYSFRTVNKTLGKVLPKEFLGTFIEDMVNDKVSMSHPFGASVVPVLASQAKVFHTSPQFVYLPKQKALDTFNDVFANKLYLFEQKIDSDWKDDAALGNFSKYISTDNLLGKLNEDNDNLVDQEAFVRARLLDMFINDWDRHEDQWEWGEKEVGERTIYTPVPQDRDQALFTNNGVALRFLISISGLSYFQPMKDDLGNVNKFNYEQRNLDRLFANQMTLDDWQRIAKEFEAAFTDAVIEQAVHQMPPESFAVSGEKIISTLKARRKHINEWATEYYEFIAREVDIVGSKKHEYFDVKRISEDETKVTIYKINKEGVREEKPIYNRNFNSNYTREIRLYGLSGNDVYTVGGQANNRIKVRLIGGDEKDTIRVNGGRVHIYDNADNVFEAPNTRLHISEDSAIHEYRYKSFLYSKKGFRPNIFFTNDDRFFVGIMYSILTQKWRVEPFASKQAVQLNYSISQKAFSVIYDGLFPKAVGKADLLVNAAYDQVRWTNFFGLGNETEFAVKDIDFYRARTEEWEGSLGLQKKVKNHIIQFNGNFRQIKVLEDFDRFIAKVPNPSNELFRSKKFAGTQFVYRYRKVNDAIVPTKGFEWTGSVSYTQNLKETSRQVGDFLANFRYYIPLIPKVSLSIGAGAQTVVGNPEFYQYASLGGTQQMRAFRRGRYWGETAVYNSNEIRYTSEVKSYLYNGKAGLLLFYDNGRVWMPGDKSKVWHDGYGFGVLLAPFNKIAADITYGFSRDDRLIQLRLSRTF